MQRSLFFQKAIKLLAAAGIESPALDSRLLCCHAWKIDQLEFIKNGHYILTDQEIYNAEQLINQRIKRIPLAYICNIKYFWKNDFYVDNRVLIPRPDSEKLVETALFLQQNQILPSCPFTFCELGIGSGCISIALLQEWEKCYCIGIDYSEDALDVARINFENNKLHSRYNLVRGNWGYGIKSNFPLIIANPPYVRKNEIKSLSCEVNKEPTLALNGGYDGLDTYREILRHQNYLADKHSIFLFEIGFDQATDVISLALEQNLEPLTIPDSKITGGIVKDSAGHDRVIVLRKN